MERRRMQSICGTEQLGRPSKAWDAAASRCISLGFGVGRAPDHANDSMTDGFRM